MPHVACHVLCVTRDVSPVTVTNTTATARDPTLGGCIYMLYFMDSYENLFLKAIGTKTYGRQSY